MCLGFVNGFGEKVGGYEVGGLGWWVRMRHQMGVGRFIRTVRVCFVLQIPPYHVRHHGNMVILGI